jgi:hypothetical protein
MAFVFHILLRVWNSSEFARIPGREQYLFILLKRSSSPGAIIIAAHLEAAQTKQDMEKRLHERVQELQWSGSARRR